MRWLLTTPAQKVLHAAADCLVGADGELQCVYGTIRLNDLMIYSTKELQDEVRPCRDTQVLCKKRRLSGQDGLCVFSE